MKAQVKIHPFLLNSELFRPRLSCTMTMYMVALYLSILYPK